MDKISVKISSLESDIVGIIERANLHPAVVELVVRNVLSSVTKAVLTTEDSEEENDPNAENNPKS